VSRAIERVVLTSARTGAPLSMEEIILWINYAQDGLRDEERRRVANEIFPLSGTLLSNNDIHFVITAGITDEQIKSKLKIRNEYFTRMAILLPEILRVLRISNVDNAKSATHLIDDAISDVPIVSSSDHKSKKKREKINRLNKLQLSIESVSNELHKSSYDIDIEYLFHRKSLSRLYNDDIREIDILAKEIKDLLFIVKLTLAKHNIGEKVFFISSNAVKAHIVECAYTLSLWNDYPRFVTTPASEFSHLCGLLFEAATGKAEESFAGAISTFSNSEERRESNIIYQEGERMNSDAYMREREGDNFYDIREELEQLSVELSLFEKLQTGSQWNSDDKARLYLRQRDILQQIESASTRVGPFLVWASQISRNDPRVKVTEKLLQTSLDMDVAIGRLRRSNRGD
jgi:hypothetical protein